jgi:hypothetical protein
MRDRLNGWTVALERVWRGNVQPQVRSLILHIDFARGLGAGSLYMPAHRDYVPPASRHPTG